jgi:adenosylcobinamide-GDP ribazoletransferase
MRSLLRCCNLCFSMYCKLPTFPTRWDPRDMRYVLCFFPLVGLVQGLFLLLWLTLCRTFSLQPVLQGALLAVLPLVERQLKKRFDKDGNPREETV